MEDEGVPVRFPLSPPPPPATEEGPSLLPPLSPAASLGCLHPELVRRRRKRGKVFNTKQVSEPRILPLLIMKYS